MRDHRRLREGNVRQLLLVLLVLSLGLFTDTRDARAADPFTAYKDGDYATAFAGFQELTKQGNPNAMNNLGLMYANGLGVDLDLAAARRWYEEAAGKGSLSAINNLGAMYETGEGVQQNYQEAATKYAIAAKYGLSDAQYNLGALYESGKGLPVDPLQAYLWYSLAAIRGDADAAVARDRVGALIDPALRSQAAAYVKDWKPAQ
jgi:TPR repeat protein